MLDINLLRKDLDAAVRRLETRKNPQPFLDVDRFRALEAERKTIQTRTEELQARRNSLSKQIGQLKSRGASAQGQVDAVMADVGSIKDELESSAARLEQLQAELLAVLLAVPNLPHASVPVGTSEADNVVLRSWGTPRVMDFPVKDHVDVGAPLGLDFDLGVKLTGARFTVLKGPIARLHRALAQFMLDVQTQEHGYTECYTPYIVNADSLRGTGQLPKFEGDLFAAKKGGQEAEDNPDTAALYLIPTSEVPLTNFVRDEVLALADLPLRLTAHTPCFRSEAQLRARHPRHDPPAPVRQGRDGADRASGAQLRGTRRHDAACRSHPAAPGPALPRDGVVHGRHGSKRVAHARSRSLAAGAEHLP